MPYLRPSSGRSHSHRHPRFFILTDDLALIDDGDTVGDVDDFIQLEGDKKDGLALVPLGLPGPCERIRWLRRPGPAWAVRRSGDRGRIGDLPGDDNLLLVSAGQGAGDIVSRHPDGYRSP